MSEQGERWRVEKGYNGWNVRYLAKPNGVVIGSQGQQNAWGIRDILNDYEATIATLQQQVRDVEAKASLAADEFGGTDEEVGTWEEQPYSDPVRKPKLVCRWCLATKPNHRPRCNKARYDALHGEDHE